MQSRLAATFFVTQAMVLVDAPPAHACSVALVEIVDTWPRDGDVDVPTNVTLWTVGAFGGASVEVDDHIALTMRDDQGNDVPLTQRVDDHAQHNDAGWYRGWQPTAPLSAQTTYIVREASVGSEQSFDWLSFTTGDTAETLDPPIAPHNLEIIDTDVSRDDADVDNCNLKGRTMFSFAVSVPENLIVALYDDDADAIRDIRIGDGRARSNNADTPNLQTFFVGDDLGKKCFYARSIDHDGMRSDKSDVVCAEAAADGCNNTSATDIGGAVLLSVGLLRRRRIDPN